MQFNRRVLEQAKDAELPVLKRLKFLCIAGTNLNEFFEIRVAGLKQRIASGSVQAGPDNFSPIEVISHISDQTLTVFQFEARRFQLFLLEIEISQSQRVIFQPTVREVQAN